MRVRIDVMNEELRFFAGFGRRGSRLCVGISQCREDCNRVEQEHRRGRGRTVGVGGSCFSDNVVCNRVAGERVKGTGEVQISSKENRTTSKPAVYCRSPPPIACSEH